MPSDESLDDTHRKECPNCGEETEFVQFATGKESTVVTGPNAVGDGILELRVCNCGTGIENVLTVEKQRSVYTDSARSLAGVGTQNRCRNGTRGCSGPHADGLPCSECFFQDGEKS